MNKNVYEFTKDELIYVLTQFYRFAPKNIYVEYQGANHTNSIDIKCSFSVKDIKIKSHSLSFYHKNKMFEWKLKGDRKQIFLCKIVYVEQVINEGEWWIEFKGLKIIFIISQRELLALLENHRRITEMDQENKALNDLLQHIFMGDYCFKDVNKEHQIETMLSYLIELNQRDKNTYKCLKTWVINQYKLNHAQDASLGVSSHNLISDFQCLNEFKPSVILLEKDQALKVDVLFILYYWQGISDYKCLASRISALLNPMGCCYLFMFGENHFYELTQLLILFDPRLRLLTYERFNLSLKKSLGTKFKQLKIHRFQQTNYIRDLDTILDYIQKNLDPLSIEILKKENKVSDLVEALSEQVSQPNGLKLTTHLICLSFCV